MNSSKISPELQSRVLGAITKALEEEKRPKRVVIFKTLLYSFLLLGISAAPLYFLVHPEMSWRLVCVALSWFVLYLAAFALYFKAQPRLSVRGHWLPWTFGRLLIGAVVGTVLTILVCPDSVFLHSQASYSTPFAAITDKLMELGGMKACMLFCGFFFAMLSSTLALLGVWKVAEGTDARHASKVLFALFMAQIPLLLFQVSDENLREFSLHWIIGILVGIAAAFGIIRALSLVLKSQEIRK